MKGGVRRDGSKPVLIEHSCISLNINWQLISSPTRLSWIYLRLLKGKSRKSSSFSLSLLVVHLLAHLLPPLASFNPVIWFSAFISISFLSYVCSTSTDQDRVEWRETLQRGSVGKEKIWRSLVLVLLYVGLQKSWCFLRSLSCFD